jgi:hypothetical protein
VHVAERAFDRPEHTHTHTHTHTHAHTPRPVTHTRVRTHPTPPLPLQNIISVHVAARAFDRPEHAAGVMQQMLYNHQLGLELIAKGRETETNPRKAIG